jgi:ParB family chromosome partitioning protein
VNEGLKNVETARIRTKRQHRNSANLDELAESIREHGILEPLLVRKKGSTYELLAGARRLEAACKAGLKTVPVVELDVSDEKALEISLVENLQRENLAPLEVATALSEGIRRFNMSQRQLAKKLGKDVAWVNRHVRLLDLPKSVRESLTRVNGLTEGHARHLLGLSGKEQSRIARLVVEKNLTTRETEMVVRRARIPNVPESLKKRDSNKSEGIHNSSEINDLSPERWKEYADKFALQFHSVWPMSRRHDPFFGVNGTIYPGTFPMMVPLNCILRYSKEGEVVLDPLAGSGTTLVACAMTRRLGIGVDINPEAEKAKEKRFKAVLEKEPSLKKLLERQKFIQGDSRSLSFLPNASVDLVIAHPPYLDMMDYGPNGTYSEVDNFNQFIDALLDEMFGVLKPGRFCCVQIGPYAAKHLPLHYIVCQHALHIGFEFVDEVVLAFLKDYVGYSSSVSGRDTAIAHKEAFAKWFSITHNVYNHNHEYLIILRKPA